MLADLPKGRVLDAPCGDGLLTRQLVGLGHEVWACDIDPRALGSADGIKFDVADLNDRLPYPDDFFDAIVSLEGIEHLDMPTVCLREFARVLSPGGRLVLSTPNVNNVQSRYHYFLSGRFGGFRPVTRMRIDDSGAAEHSHVTLPYLPTLVYHLRRAGLHVDAIAVTMVKTKQWLLVPLAIPMWLSGRRAPRGTLAHELGSWRLLLGRSVILSGVKWPR